MMNCKPEAGGIVGRLSAVRGEPQLQFPHFPHPWEFREEGHNGGPGVFDAAGSCIAALFWPTHPVEETAQAEQETYDLGKAIASLGATSVPQPPQWISVEERLPELGEMVLTFRCGKMQSDYLGKNKHNPILIWTRECVQVNGNVTHWQPLPDPPQVEGTQPKGA